MREILFRGKRKDNGKWVEGGFSIVERFSFIILPFVEWDDDVHMEIPQFVEVDPETVCQYTGLTDKNGRKIFEGDCLGHELNVVEYMNGCYTVSGDRPLSLMAKYNEVIGNIFDKE